MRHPMIDHIGFTAARAAPIFFSNRKTGVLLAPIAAIARLFRKAKAKSSSGLTNNI
jgi:hypothetical protein